MKFSFEETIKGVKNKIYGKEVNSCNYFFICLEFFIIITILALADNRKFEMGFTLTCDQFLRNFPQNATKEDLLAIGDQLAACHDEYKSVTLSKDPRPYVRWPYGALRSAFYGRIQSAELDKLQNPSKETALTRFAR